MQEKHRWAARPTTQACALTRSQTSDLSIHRLVLHPVSHTSQGSSFRIFLKKLFYWFSITVVCIYPPSLPPPQAIPASLPCFHPPWFCPCVLYSFSWKTLPSSLPLSPPIFPLVTVTLLLVSMFLVIFCLLVCFVDYVPVKGEIIWYLSLTTWLISLSITLSGSTHAVAKGRSSFSFPAA